MKIEQNIKFPTPRKAKGELKNLFLAMNVGDSFAQVIDELGTSEPNYRASLNASARAYNVKITSRKTLEDGIWVMRTWRVA